MKYQFVYLNVVAVSLNELDSVCLNTENLPGGSLKDLFVYLKIRIFKCSYRMFKRHSERNCQKKKAARGHLQMLESMHYYS